MRWGWLYIVLFCFWGEQVAGQACRVVFYNVENLFDTCDDPFTKDEEFTPGGAKHWTERRYREKLLHLAGALNEAGGEDLPAFIGLAEVENRAVVNELIQQPGLREGNYRIVHRDSPDLRGIDVAFLYRPSVFRVLDTAFFNITFPEDTTLTTRDILYVCGVVGKETLHFMVCHFPSMYGGETKSEWKRVQTARVVRRKTDSIREADPGAKIVIMGDLNGKANTAAQKVLGTQSSDRAKIVPDSLYNTGYYLLDKDYGSYRYRGNWQTLDHIIVSGTLFQRKRGLRAERRMKVFSAPFLLEEDRRYSGYKPLPSYRGPRYYGGYSDHLPVYLDLFRGKR